MASVGPSLPPPPFSCFPFSPPRTPVFADGGVARAGPFLSRLLQAVLKFAKQVPGVPPFFFFFLFFFPASSTMHLPGSVCTGLFVFVHESARRSPLPPSLFSASFKRKRSTTGQYRCISRSSSILAPEQRRTSGWFSLFFPPPPPSFFLRLMN